MSPPNVAIHGELSHDHQRIILVAAGSNDALIARAALQLQTLTPLFKTSEPKGALVTAATWQAVVQLSAEFGTGFMPGAALSAWIADQISRRGVDSDGLSYHAPAGLTPYRWQIEGAAMIRAVGRALITDEPGTGKTITTILGLLARHGDDLGPVLVVCPASVVDAWVAAWRTWAPAVATIAWRGTPARRHRLAGTAQVYVTSYDTARTDARPSTTAGPKPLLELGAAALVIDECHQIKNPRAARSEAVRRLAKKVADQGTVIALSGTPITHHPGDLWPALNALFPGAYPSRERWVARYCLTLPSEDYGETILGLDGPHEPEFRLSLLGHERRVAKADVLTELPPKVYSVRTVELPHTRGHNWRKSYDDMETRMLAELPDGSELSVMSALAQLTRLSQLASAPAEVEVTEELDEATGELRPHTKVTLLPGSWKVDALLEILEERTAVDGVRQPVVAFAPSRQLMRLAGAAAAEAGLRVGYIVGGQTPTERSAQVAAFQDGDLDLICVTTGAGGVGLTLTAARTVVFLQRPWSLVEALQAEDRCHRIGAEKHDSIEIIDIVAANTIDTRIRAVLRERAGQLADLVRDPRVLSELLGGAPKSRTEPTDPKEAA